MSRLSAPETVLEVTDLDLYFDQEGKWQQALHAIDLHLYKNEILAIVGESGSGKSVLSKVLMGLLTGPNVQVEANKIHLLDHDVRAWKYVDWSRFRGSEISMIFQEPMSALNPTVTCGQQVMEVLGIHKKLSRKECRQRTIELFRKVQLPQPSVLFDKYPHEISGGQMQRVMIAMAVACNPKILIADEPTTALDVTVQKEIMELLKSLQEEFGMSMIFISHDLGLVHSIADRIIVMRQGKVVEENFTDQIFNSPQHQYTKALLAARPNSDERVRRLPTVRDFIDGTKHENVISPSMRTQTHKKLYKLPPVLIVDQVTKDYALKKKLFQKQQYYRAVDNVSFKLYPGESLGLVGESGCGKSTLGNVILGLREATSGKIIFDGVDITRATGKQIQILRKKMQIIFQDPFASLNPRIKIGPAIAEPMKWHGIGNNDKDRRSRVETLLKKIGLTARHYDRYPHEFSGGQRQRIGIARAVALEPELIVCDESVSALDISVQAQVLNLLNDLKDDYGFSYLFISHDLAVVKYFCDRVVVMNQGKIEEIGEADAVFHHPASDYTQKLIDAIPK
jgi:peptide/nickel transport system ATP-binding protein